MLMSVIIPTKNEAKHIEKCVSSFHKIIDNGTAEVIVVDNFSADTTAELAVVAGARVVSKGQERSSQRNYGALVEACGEYIFFVDADMIVENNTLSEIVELLVSNNPPDGIYVREHIVGSGFWAYVRNFERSFYDCTCIDAVRVVKKSILKAVNGFDETLYAGEDWDLDRRIRNKTDKLVVTGSALNHNEGAFSLIKHLKKKRYYAKNFDLYCRKWNYDAVIKKQFGLKYRLWTVFMENGKWKKSLRNPHMLCSIWFYKLLVGFIFFTGSRKQT